MAEQPRHLPSIPAEWDPEHTCPNPRCGQSIVSMPDRSEAILNCAHCEDVAFRCATPRCHALNLLKANRCRKCAERLSPESLLAQEAPYAAVTNGAGRVDCQRIGSLADFFPGWPVCPHDGRHLLIGDRGRLGFMGPSGSIGIYEQSRTNTMTFVGQTEDRGDTPPVGLCFDGRYLIAASERHVMVTDWDPVSGDEPARLVFTAGARERIRFGPFRWTRDVLIGVARDGRMSWVTIPIARELSDRTPTSQDVDFLPCEVVATDQPGIVWIDQRGLWEWRPEGRPRCLVRKEELSRRGFKDLDGVQPGDLRVQGESIAFAAWRGGGRQVLLVENLRGEEPKIRVMPIVLDEFDLWNFGAVSAEFDFVVAGSVDARHYRGGSFATQIPTGGSAGATPLMMRGWTILSTREHHGGARIIVGDPQGNIVHTLPVTGEISPHLCWQARDLYYIDGQGDPGLSRLSFRRQESA